MEKDRRTPYERRREAVARAFAASIMGLVKDAEGANLPDDCWQQMAAMADAVLFIASTGKDHEEAGRALERNLVRCDHCYGDVRGECIRVGRCLFTASSDVLQDKLP